MISSAFTAGGRLRLHNLRPSTGSPFILEQCPRPVRRYTGTARPVAAAGDITILADGTALSLEAPSGVVTAAATLPAPPAAIVKDADELLVMTSVGAQRLAISVGDTPSATLTPAATDYPPVSLTAVDAGPVTATVAARTLSQVYTGGTLAARDRDALLADLSDAYRALVSQASAAGAMPQPAIARYRLRTADGRVLFTSPPVLLSLAAGSQCAQAVEVFSTDRCTASAYTLSATCWQLRVEAPVSEDDAVRRAAVLEVYLTPPLHPFRSGGRGSATLGRLDSTSTPFVRLTLPGNSHAIDAAHGAGAALTLRSLMARLDDVESCVLTINDPFGSGAGDRTVPLPLSADVDTDNAIIDSSLRCRCKAVPYTTRMLAAPHTFTAAVGTTGSGVTAWGDLTIHRYRGHSAAAFVALATDAPWTATVRVRFADGSACIRSESFTTGAPVAFNPILSYPAPDAVEMTIVAYYGGVNHRFNAPLTPDPSRGRAVYIHSGMKPFTLPQASAVQLIDGAPRAICMPRAVAFARAEAPLDIVTYTTLTAAPAAIVHAGAVQQAWEYGRTRFAIATAAGVDSCTVNISTAGSAVRSFLTVAPGEGAPVLCCGEPGEIFAAAGKVVYLITGSRIAAIGERGECFGLAYDRHRAELWCLAADGSVRVMCRRHGWAEYRTSMLRYTALSMAPGFFCALGDGFYARPDVDSLPAQGFVEMQLRSVPASERPGRLTVACTAASFDGGVSMSAAAALHTHPVKLLDAYIDGAVTAPIVLPMAPRAVRAFDIDIAATVSDFRLTSLTVARP